MDPLSELLLSLTPTAHVISVNELRGDWGFVTPNYPASVAFSAYMIEGRMWVRCNDSEPFWLEHGESVLISGGGIIEYRSAPDSITVPIDRSLQGSCADLSDLEQIGEPLVLKFGTGQPLCRMLSLGVVFRSYEANPLLSTFSPFYRMRRSDDRMERLITGATEFLAGEIERERPGYRAAAAHLTELVVTEQLRTLALDFSSRTWPNVFRGLAHPRIGRALNAIYKSPGRPWTVAALAKVSGMSRSTFALRFNELIGTPVHDYLTHWRMNCAAEMLRKTPAPKSDRLAAALGYASERAFRTAFRRVHGCSPAEYARSHAAQITVAG